MTFFASCICPPSIEGGLCEFLGNIPKFRCPYRVAGLRHDQGRRRRASQLADSARSIIGARPEDTHVLIGTPDQLFAEYTAHTVPALTAAALGSRCGEEACGLFGELFRKLEVRAVPGIRVEDQPGVG
jgi:hypothetical protein